jgi:hypothetical protein
MSATDRTSPFLASVSSSSAVVLEGFFKAAAWRATTSTTASGARSISDKKSSSDEFGLCEPDQQVAKGCRIEDVCVVDDGEGHA